MNVGEDALWGTEPTPRRCEPFALVMWPIRNTNTVRQTQASRRGNSRIVEPASDGADHPTECLAAVHGVARGFFEEIKQPGLVSELRQD